MVACAGQEMLSVAAGDVIVVDGERGEVVVAAAASRVDAALEATARRVASRERAAAERALPAATTDGRAVRVLANASAAAEVGLALDAGAEGVGLLRTELHFLDARAWPSEEAQRRALGPVLAPLAGRTVTVRVFDFGADKTPPFLAGTPLRGLRLLLETPGVLEAQLRAIVAAGADVDLRVLLPLVERPEEVACVREMLPRGVALGAMIETPHAVDASRAIAEASDFLSIGTNDLTASTLGVERFGPGACPAHDPRVLRHVERIATGEAAGDPRTLPLLVGFGVDELSVGAARVGAARRWVRAISLADSQQLAARAAAARDVDEVERLTAEIAARLRAVDGTPGGERVAVPAS
jgi:phosphoenolpyruvate-protein kinase (PTS system EI component)